MYARPFIPNTNKNGEICSICGKRFYEFGNNARPLNTGRCCNNCDDNIIRPLRFYLIEKYNAGNYNEFLLTISYDKEQS